ncbi:cytochrome P450 [Pseudonocardia kujensis]|uniref:cytochrome P450 n=1 Tax=Pseudonocardia kujensis TaxID=1128675 RepID=UPI001E4B6DEB|nr:cytochrome P450 [Pseudonocardia kujensis]MCE0764880.1 cytochrome P450 [Pseudonocardia kujensis]
MRFNPFAPSFRQDPYAQYAALRAELPIRTLGMWVLTRHTDVLAVLRDRSFSAELIPALVARHGGAVDTDLVLRLGRASLVFTDNPAHARLRGLVNRVFTPAAVADLEPLVHELAQRRVSGLRHDLMAELAEPLPVEVLCTWLGLPAELHGQVAGWTHEIRFLLEPGMLKRDHLERISRVVATFAAALREVRTPGLLRELAAVRTAGGDRLTEEETALLGIMCFVAGTETTAALIGNSALALLRSPGIGLEQVPATVRETLRHESPLQMTTRIATREIEIGGVRIAAGDQVLLCLAAANRDPAVFPNPDTFDPARGPGPHLGFGFGMHGCLGGALAELQARAVLDTLVRGPDLRLDGEVRWQTESLIVRSPEALPVTVAAGAR